MTDTDLADWQPWLRTVARGIDPDLVDDLAQEGMVAMWESFATHDPAKSPLNYWLKKQATWRMLSVTRSARRASAIPVEDMIPLVDAPYEVPEYSGDVQRALTALSPREREYVYLRFWVGMRYGELNKHFRLSNTSTSIWNSAKEKLAHLAEV